ncbi:MAG: ABC transporter substrate-binding protein, partial [Gammaproteobacteria bacterium]|nr:ABC transporter substrate-binding protein [Gammaproteobacteria bacterium]
PTKSDVYSIKQLKGKTISVPIGSAAWGMLYKMAQDSGMKISDFKIVNQGPMEGITSIAMEKVDAHADFCPMSEYMEYKGTGRMIYSGSETGVPYLHGVVVRQSFAQKYPEIVVAYIKAVIAADQWIEKNPQYASEMMSKWTMIPKEVLYLYYSKGGYLTPDPTIKPLWVKTLEFDHTVLAKYGQIGPLDFKKWITDKYIRAAYKELGLNYDKELKALYKPIQNVHRRPEIWVASAPVTKYPSVKSMLAAVATLKAQGKKIDATYVYDAKTGLKLFGNLAFYVKHKDGTIVAFMRKDEAERNATHGGGAILSFAQAISAIRTAGTKENSRVISYLHMPAAQ